ncbi:tetratricopeptide repeat protein [Hyphomicrobium sp.]|uniref:tetratricopeptide repeat protein n=1 Tax=Hyphomicrobium sp. TaxID=82 RepID=UPI003F72EAE0
MTAARSAVVAMLILPAVVWGHAALAQAPPPTTAPPGHAVPLPYAAPEAIEPGAPVPPRAPSNRALPDRLQSGPQGPIGPAPGPTAQENPAKLLEELYARLATAPDEATGTQIASAIEQLWQHSGSPTADLLTARAAAAMEANKRDLAMQLLNAAVEQQPDYAEAWNRRAYLFYLDEDYKRSLGDLRRVLALEPHHFKALEGLANILQHLGEKKAALEAYDALLKVHPQVQGGKKARDDLKVEVEGQGI